MQYVLRLLMMTIKKMFENLEPFLQSQTSDTNIVKNKRLKINTLLPLFQIGVCVCQLH